VETYPVPEAALHEVELNALIHKDCSMGGPVQISVYADRLIGPPAGALRGGALGRVEPQFRLARSVVGPVAREAGASEDGADVAGKVDGLPRTQRGQIDGDRNGHRPKPDPCWYHERDRIRGGKARK
jgi:hypothetical protein